MSDSVSVTGFAEYRGIRIYNWCVQKAEGLWTEREMFLCETESKEPEIKRISNQSAEKRA